jgi:hypothetical protein
MCPQLLGLDRIALTVSFPQNHPRRNHDQLDVLDGLCMPTDNALREHVDDDCDVNPSGPGAVKSRFSKSPARIPSFVGIAVRVPLSRRIPANPSARIARSIAPREAPGIVVRRISAVILRRP